MKFNKTNKRPKKDIKNLFCTAIILAAGQGNRMGTSTNKQYLNLNHLPILSYTLQAFESSIRVNEIIILVREEDIIICKEIVEDFNIKKAKKIIVGGKERYNSVYNGLQEIDKRTNIVAVHDGARPLIKPEDINFVIDMAYNYDAAILGVKVNDTIKTVNDDNCVMNTPERDKLWTIQTPQAFKLEILNKAYEKAIENNIFSTDDSMLVEQIGYTVKVVEGSYSNIKITNPEDIIFAEALLQMENSDLH